MPVFVIVTLTLSLLLNPAGFNHATAQNSVRDNVPEPHDPCEQALVPPGNANGLHKRCDAIGTGAGAAKGDFDGDGFADLAVGVPFEDQNGIGSVGGVNIIYGSSAGLTSTGDQFLDETNFGFAYQTGDHFGWALAAGDFNGDGYSDLAIGAPDRNDEFNRGVVFVINGSASGLNTSTAQKLDLDLLGRAGAALVWGDFNGDGFADLAVGAPDASLIGFTGCIPLLQSGVSVGFVEVWYGAPRGLTSFGSQRWGQFGAVGCGADFQVGDSPEDGDRFGSSLAAGDFNADGCDDLVIGVPFEDLGLFDKQDAGMVHLITGGISGLGRRSQNITQDTSGVGGAAETGDQFGRVFAVGDFNGDGKDDLAVGVPFEDLNSNNADDAGAVHVFLGIPDPDVLVATSGSIFISQASLPAENIEAGDRFGWALTAGDFDGDGKDDLAIGSPGEDVSSNTIKDAGLVSVLYGSSSGPSFTRVQEWTQDSSGVPDSAETGDQFGYALSAWNYGNGFRSDLAIGVPFEDVLSTSTDTQQIDAGAVNLIYGSLSGLNTTDHPAQFWTQDSSGINDSAQQGDRFGQSLY